MEQTIIEISGLTKKYGNRTAVNNLNLSINKGEVFGLLGPNGAGKTTTILMLLGLTEPTSGIAAIDGLECIKNPIEVKTKVGYLPDNVGFYADMTGRQNLRFTGRMNGLEGEALENRMNELLERVGMTYAADQKTGTYSRGMRQRLGVADVLMKDPKVMSCLCVHKDPKVIIMDEPTLGIDPEGMRELLTLIRKLSREDGRTILISSHQLYQIQQICDRVGIFVEGNLIACGKIADLGKQVQKDKRYRLEIMAHPLDDRLLMAIHGQKGVEKIEKEGDMFIVQSNTDIRKEMTEYLGISGYTILHMHQRGGDLDEIYRLYFEKAGQSDEDNRNNKKKRRRGRNKK